MEVIYSGRKTGRTQHLINLAAEAEKNGECCYIIVHNHEAAYHLKQRADEQGLNIAFPLTYEEFMNREYYGQHIHKFFIDNADWLLQSLTLVPIVAITLEKKADDE